MPSRMSSKKLRGIVKNTLDPALKRRAVWIVKKVNPKNGERILDIGCGDGYYLHLISALGVDVVLAGVDKDKKALRSAKKNLEGRKVELRYGDLMKKIPYRVNSFDKVIMSEVLEHLPDDARGLREVRRVLRKNGLLVISVPNANYPFLWDPVNWVLEKFFGRHVKSGFWAGIWNQHERLYKRSGLVKLVSANGFNVIDSRSITYWSLPFHHYIVNLGARVLSKNKTIPIATGADKFSKIQNRSLVVSVYTALSDFMDKFNSGRDYKSGVSLVLLAKNRK